MTIRDAIVAAGRIHQITSTPLPTNLTPHPSGSLIQTRLKTLALHRLRTCNLLRKIFKLQQNYTTSVSLELLYLDIRGYRITMSKNHYWDDSLA